MTPRTPRRAASHFGLGGSRHDLKEIGDAPLGWVLAQLDDERSVEISGLPAAKNQLARFFEDRADSRQAQRMAGEDDRALASERRRRRENRQRMQWDVGDNLSDRFAQAVATETPVKERLALFWSNHFTVSRQGRPQITSACCAFENETIRISLDDHFSDLLLRVASHPVMLVYLDNAQSVGPGSRMGRRRGRGLNENLAREILELHTLGVDGGYTQMDVLALAKIITGWTVGNGNLRQVDAEPGAYTFVPYLHEPGTHKLLGKSYSDKGREQGVEALRDLARHPSTARHIATKLVRHFVTDVPDEADIDAVARVYMDTDGHLPSVHRAVLSLDSAWSPGNRKLKTPYELLVSAFRGLEIPGHRGAEQTMGTLRTMDHLPFTASSPAGWPDTARYWHAPTALQHRIEWGVEVGRRMGNSIDAMSAARVLVDATPELIASLASSESPTQALSLLLASPDFQWR